jgi:hypothetical protein
MAALTTTLATIAASLGYGVYNLTPGSVDSTIFENSEPPLIGTTPAAVTTIYQTGGPADTQTYDGDTNGEQTAQIRMRDPDQATLQARILGLYGTWAAWKRYPAYFVTVKASTKVMFSYPQQDSDQGNLWIASFNVRCIVGS